MNTPPTPVKPIIILIGNYPLDRQESMLRFRNLILIELQARGFHTYSVFPKGYLGHIQEKGPLAKWLGYVDKFIFFPIGLARLLSTLKSKFPDRKVVVHICDHSNAVYTSLAKHWYPVLISCHDLLAVRGALGEDTDCPASGFGKLLQKAILRGLGQATAVACVSRFTQADLIRLAEPDLAERTQVIPPPMTYPHRPVPREEAMGQLARANLALIHHGFVLHVGSALRRKNREALLLSVARIKDVWPGKIVFAGERLTAPELSMVQSLGLGDRVCEISPDGETLQALYSAALCFIFMSRSEGFGLPILEAQASGCPVICSNRTAVPEAAGEGALIHDPEDHAAVAADIQHLQDPAYRDKVVASGFKNMERFTNEKIMAAYEEIYRHL